MSFTPEELYRSILNYLPDFKILYNPDFRDNIATGWSESIDDILAREDWQWKPNFDLKSMTVEMLTKVKEIYKY